MTQLVSKTDSQGYITKNRYPISINGIPIITVIIHLVLLIPESLISVKIFMIRVSYIKNFYYNTNQNIDKEELLCIKNINLYIFLSLITLLTITLGGQTISFASDSNEQTSNTVVKSTYNLSNVDSNTLNKMNEIASQDPNVKETVNNGQITIEQLLPSSDDQSTLPISAYTRFNSQKNYKFESQNLKTINFSTFINKMDQDNNIKMKNGSKISMKRYKGQTTYGQHVKTNTHVHCNRFNGSHSDHKYWGEKDPRAWSDFYHSDCDWHAINYNCSSSKSKMTKCHGLNEYGNGVKDCSSWKSQKRRHHNWSKQAWYRNAY
ncbi:hypothetical protein IV48_GL001178 [Fructilactobacillus fructivorans]|nr:hypothetical protein IV51_GL000134 [Fructilactobacillus fructivorans]KRN42772.1 hypothetical protein IV48_GL001178 [Fructilactobacillus fructivorans]